MYFLFATVLIHQFLALPEILYIVASSVGLILLYQHVSYADYFLPALIPVVAVIGFWLVLVIMDKKLLQQVSANLPQVAGCHSIRKLVELVVHIFSLILLAFGRSLLMPNTPTIFIVSTIIVIYSMVWIFLLGALKELQCELAGYNRNFDNYIQFLPFLIALSFFGAAVSLSPFGDHISGILVLFNTMPLYFVGMSCMLFVAILSLCGIHMIIPVTTLALTVAPETLNLTPLCICVVAHGVVGGPVWWFHHLSHLPLSQVLQWV